MDNIELFLRKFNAENNYYIGLLNKKIGDVINPILVNNVINNLYDNPNYIYQISKIKNIDKDFILLNDSFRFKIISIITASHLINLEDINGDVIETDKKYIDKLTNDTYKGLLIADLDNLDGSSIFLSNPIISNILCIINIIKKELNDLSNPWVLEIRNIIESIESMFILFDKSCFSQAMSVFRQALEQYITIKCLAMYPNALSSFLSHQDITIKDAIKTLSKEELDEYIKNNNLNYNNYKSYLNYGWLDEIEEFRILKKEKPNTKYSIKTVSIISDSLDFYDAMDFASNYVHSNFVFVKLNWNMVLSEVIDGIYQIIDWLINNDNLSLEFNFIINGFNFIELYNEIKNRALDLIKNEDFDYNIK